MTDVNVRGIDNVLWHRLRVEAVKRGLSMGALLNLILRKWLDEDVDE
jgi:plasmid stability protein